MNTVRSLTNGFALVTILGQFFEQSLLTFLGLAHLLERGRIKKQTLFTDLPGVKRFNTQKVELFASNWQL